MKQAVKQAVTRTADAAAELAASDPLFDSAITPTRADTLAQYTFFTSRLGAVGYGDALAALHARALSSDPALAALFRSPEAIEDVGAAAARLATPAHDREPHAEAQRRAAAAAEARYRRAIAEQLAAVDGHELAGRARAYLDRLAAEDRTRAAALAELEAAERERELEQQARRDAERAERAKLADGAHAALAAIDAGVSGHDQAQRRARLALADAVAERLRGSGLASLRMGSGLYGVATLILQAPNHSVDVLREISAALDRHEAALDRREAAQ